MSFLPIYYNLLILFIKIYLNVIFEILRLLVWRRESSIADFLIFTSQWNRISIARICNP